MPLAINKTIRAACALALAGLVHHAPADTITLTNGDVLTGSVVKSDDQGLVLEHPILGTITLAAQRIETVTLDSDAATAPDDSQQHTEAGQGDNDPTDAPGVRKEQAQATEAAAREAAEQEHEKSVFQTVLEEWNTRLTLGLNGSKGNTDRQNYRVMVNAQQTKGRDRWDFNSRWVYAYANGRRNQNQFETNLTREWLQEDSDWFFFVKGQYKYDVKRSFQNRTSAFGGGGYTLAHTDDIEVNTRLGFGGTYEYGSVNEFTPEALFGGSVLSWQVSERASLAGETLFFPSLEDGNDYRIESSVEWVHKLDLASGLSFKLGLENEYNSKIRGDNENNDLKYYGAIVLSF